MAGKARLIVACESEYTPWNVITTCALPAHHASRSASFNRPVNRLQQASDSKYTATETGFRPVNNNVALEQQLGSTMSVKHCTARSNSLIRLIIRLSEARCAQAQFAFVPVKEATQHGSCTCAMWLCIADSAAPMPCGRTRSWY
jgi:hypothetical protein